MKRLLSFLTDRRFLFAGAAAALLAMGVFTLTTADGDGSIGGELVVAILCILLLAALVLLAVVMLSGADSESRDIARQITSTPVAEKLVERWLRRSRFYRFIGGLLAFALSSLVLENNNDDGLMQLLFVLLCGVAIGGALAEVHVLRRRRGTSAAADLTVRDIRDFTDPTDLVAMGVVACAAAAVLVTAAFGWREGVSVRWGIGALGTILAVLAFQYLVARRSRPALRPELREADDLLRYLAATQGFARPAIATACVMAANAIGRNAQAPFAPISTFLIVAGVVWWYRGRHGRIPKLAQSRMAT